MNNSDTFLRKYDEMLEVLSSNLHLIWLTLPEDLSDMSTNNLDSIRSFFLRSKMQNSLSQVRYIGETSEHFNHEVYSTLSSFPREKQEVYYNMILIRFLENLVWYDSRIRYGYEVYLKVMEWVRRNDNSEYYSNSRKHYDRDDYSDDSDYYSISNNYYDNSDPYSKKNFNRTMDSWKYIYSQLIDLVSKIMSELTLVLAPYLEEDNLAVIQIKKELRDLKPAQAKIILSESVPNSKELSPNEYVVDKPKDTPTKDQILLIHLLGILDIPSIKNLTTEKKGQLFGRLLNRNEKNVTEYIRNCDPNGNKQAEDNPYTYENKVDAATQLLKDIGFLGKL